MSDIPVLIRTQGRAGRITLNRPKAIHALNMPMVQAMFDALVAWKDDPAIELVVVDHAPGTRGFCAGGDVKMLSASGADDAKEALAFFALEYNLNILIKNYPKPYVPLMDGVTLGGGKGIAIFGRHRVVTERSALGMPEGNIGLFPDVGGGWFLSRLKGQLGTWMALSGGWVQGEDCIATGIGTHYVNSTDIAALTQDLCRHGDRALAGLQTDGTLANPHYHSIIKRCFAHDRVEEILQALTDEPDDWAHQQAALIRQKCPMTVKVALAQLRAGRRAQDFASWMGVEYRIGSRMCRRPDFAEGVRAVLIDKTGDPAWQPASVELVDDADVAAMFDPLGQELQILPVVEDMAGSTG